MSNTSDAIRNIIAEISKSDPLDPKWRGKQPTIQDFDLEEVNIATVCQMRLHHMVSREHRAEDIAREIPDEKQKISMEFGWEGWVMVALCVFIAIYYFTIGPTTPIVNQAISIICVVVVASYFIRAIAKKKKRKIEIQNMKDLRDRVRWEPFEQEELYQRIAAYAHAIYDHDQWQERLKPSHWKDIHQSDAREEIFSFYDMAGLEPDGTYDEYIDFTCIENGEEIAIGCPASRKLTYQMSESFKEEMGDHKITRGIIYAFGPVDNGADRFCQENGIEIRNINNFLEFVNNIN